jgi:hypothetical protein
MVGSVGEIFTAIAVVILLAGILRYTFGTGPEGALPSDDGDVGLLQTVATVPTREAAEVLAARLAREKVRATIAHDEAGWNLLVFPRDVDDAKVALRAL